MRMRPLLLAPLFLTMLSACASVPPSAASDPKAFVIRHFEKVAGPDPVLTPTGQANARRLAERLSDEHIVAVYSTDTRRTRDSAEPTRAKFGLETELYDPADNAALAQRIAAKGGSVLVIGHSNTVPGIVAMLSSQPQPDIDESRFGDLFIIDLKTRAVTHEHVGP